MNEKKILAHGEVTGHYHSVADPDAFIEGDTLQAPNGTDVNHQEHNTITIPPGTYHRGIVQEYDYVKEEARSVVD